MIYEKSTPKQRAALIFGSKLRLIQAILSMTKSGWLGEAIFNSEELVNIEQACHKALERVKVEYEARKSTETDNRSPTISC